MQKRKILVIDDEIALVNVLESLFVPRGFEVSKALKGSTGLELAMQMKPDIVILDLRMPGLQGEEVLRELKETLPETKVLVYTAWTDEKTRMKILAEGADLFMEKPGDFNTLKDNVFRLLEEKD